MLLGKRNRAVVIVSVALAFVYLNALVNQRREITQYGNISSISSPKQGNLKCLPFEKELDEVLNSSKQIFITMPAKSAGTSLKAFVNQCTNYEPIDNFINKQFEIRDFMTSSLELPKIIAGHCYSSENLINLIQNTSKNTLLVFIHREETDRLRSAIKQVVTDSLCHVNDENCKIDESYLISEVIQKRQDELHFGAPEILTCDVYNKIEETMPKMIFVNYKNVDKLQAAIAAHHCPEYLDKPVHANVDKEKPFSVSVALDKSTGESTSLEYWINAKGELLEWGYQLKREQSCQGTTRHMEDRLFECGSNGFLMVGRW